MAYLDTPKSFLGKRLLNIPKRYLSARGKGLVDIAAPRRLPLSAPTFSICKHDVEKEFPEVNRRGYLKGYLGDIWGIFKNNLEQGVLYG